MRQTQHTQHTQALQASLMSAVPLIEYTSTANTATNTHRPYISTTRIKVTCIRRISIPRQVMANKYQSSCYTLLNLLTSHADLGTIMHM